MEIDPVRLAKIQHSCTMRTLKKFSNISLDFDDILSESKLATMHSINTYDESKGYPFYSYVYSNVMNKLRNYINRKVIPQEILSEEQWRISGNIVHARKSIESFEPMMEARDRLDKLKLTLDPLSLSILSMIGEGRSYRNIARQLPICRQSVDNRVRAMREILDSQ